MSERWLIGAAILVGFLWIRTRARALRGDEERSRKALFGVFLVLAPLLLIGKQIFDRLPFDRVTNLVVELVSLVALFALTGFLFLRSEPQKETPENSTS